MASNFQRSKISGVFDAMDLTGHGYLTEGDFAALADRWTIRRGLAPDSPQHDLLRAIMLGWWQALSSTAQHADQVTLDDVLALVDQLPTMLDAVADTAHAMFEAIDENADGQISQAEYRQLVEVWNGRETDTDAIFHRLDRNGDGHLSQEEFRELWTEFWAGNDPDAPGTWVFGEFQKVS